ncbi:MAG: tRNA (adenosine(37)-N6)-dimethylallyltransferase MiaA [Chloroflexota bacterium]
MCASIKKPPIIVILGPTAVGKTALAIQLAQRINGEIISADSRLFYRGMDIGTAKPSAADQAEVPHHMIDIANPDETISLAEYQKRVFEIVGKLHFQDKTPILVGGTGQYLRAVFEGWQLPQQSPDPKLRAVLYEWADEIGAEELFACLQELDPSAAESMTPQNVRRTVRALEVILISGKRFSDMRHKDESPYRVLQIGLSRPKDILIARINQRVDSMLGAGFVDEVRGLLEGGYARDLPSMSAIGYRQLAGYLAGETSLEDALEITKQKTRQFLRRQRNWFKPTDPNINWFDITTNQTQQIEGRIKKFLG